MEESNTKLIEEHKVIQNNLLSEIERITNDKNQEISNLQRIINDRNQEISNLQKRLEER
ncbi:16722_t:CDS:2 [Dentiscutata erythropus]|uniref:16722_t:CDS:1 n=1 Tax=Dentiscutata erythropus TaxID=1348616 RepID=A0A9N9H4V6_9GLOM|nr:16722_t:CDS:2 [Dentiscutata erythropus]